MLGSSVSVLSIKLNLFLVSIFDVDSSVGGLRRFDNFKSSREDDFGVWSLLDWGECSALFGSGLEFWFFLRLTILEVGGRVGVFATFVLFVGSGLCLRCSFCDYFSEEFSFVRRITLHRWCFWSRGCIIFMKFKQGFHLVNKASLVTRIHLN